MTDNQVNADPVQDEDAAVPARLAMKPIAQIERSRLPQIGRIRMGKKVPMRNGKMRPSSSETWILTSSRKEPLDALAERYGGQVKEWDSDSRDTYILETGSDVLKVVLHPDGMQEPRYEKWTKGKCLRRCDGVVCTGYPAEGDPIDVACPCNATGDVQCKPKTHLNFMLPETTLGFWRLTTGSFTAIPELFGSAQVIQGATKFGFPEAELRIDSREGDGKKWKVPVLTSAATMNQIVAGAAGTETRVQIEAPQTSQPEPAAIKYETGDDWDDEPEVFDAEIVEEP